MPALGGDCGCCGQGTLGGFGELDEDLELRRANDVAERVMHGAKLEGGERFIKGMDALAVERVEEAVPGLVGGRSEARAIAGGRRIGSRGGRA